MKERVTSLDLMFLVEELKEHLVKAKIRRIKQIENIFIIEFFKKKKFFLKIIPDKAMYLIKKSQKALKEPSSFCMQLRKHMLGKTVSKLTQHEFDRIIEIECDGYRLVIELFGRGNIILLDDMDMILGLLNQKDWKDRSLRPKKLYKYPPGNYNPFKYSFFEFQKILNKEDKIVVSFLAIDFGLGRTYAEEVCRRLKIEKNKTTRELSQEEVDKLFRFFEDIKSAKLKPQIVFEAKKQLDAIPIEMTIYKDHKKKEFKDFNSTVATYFEKLKEFEKKEVRKKIKKKQAERIERIREKQEEQIKKLQEQEQKFTKIAKTIYREYPILVKILAQIRQSKEEGKSWKEIKEKYESYALVKRIEQRKARIVFVVDDVELDIDFRKSLKENANDYFEAAKKARSKITKIFQAEKMFVTEKERVSEKPKWYEAFRWFFTSDGFLVIAGKNAGQNEEIVNKYARPYDLVLHADIHGSPFAVIRNDSRTKIPLDSIREAAEFDVSYSRAWKVGPVDVYYVDPKQVVKVPGLPVGSFLIRGKRDWVKKVEPRLAVGIEKKLIVGPVSAVKNQTEHFVTIVPGNKPAEDLAKEIKSKLMKKASKKVKNILEKIDLEKIKNSIPYGRGELVE